MLLIQIIYNPPYIDSEIMTKVMPDLRKYYSNTFEVAKGNWDIFLLFIELGSKLNSKNGICSMIVPNKLIAAKYAIATRRFISNNYLKLLRDYSEINVFDNVAVYPVVFILEKKAGTDEDVECTVMDTISIIRNKSIIPWKLMKNEDNWDRFFNVSQIQNILIDKIRKGVALGKIATVRGAATVNEAYEIKKYLIEEKEPKSNHKIFINTGTIDKYSTSWLTSKTQYIKQGYYCPVIDYNQLKLLYPTRAKEANEEKLLIAGMTKELECYYDEGKCLAGKSTVIVYESNISLKYLCGILNSKLMSWYYSIYYNSLSLAGGFYRIGAPQIKELPIINDKLALINQMENLVNQRISNNDTSLNSTIDNLVYQIYGLSNDEIELIENSI